MNRNETQTFVEEVNERREQIRAHHEQIVQDAVKAAESVIRNSGEDSSLLLRRLAKKLVHKVKSGMRKPPGNKSIWDTGLPNKQVDIHFRGRQGVLPGDIKIKGKLMEQEDNHVIIRVPKENVLGWEFKGGAYYRRLKERKLKKGK